tara:strand:+ start:110073 stop:110861 length:789 start_codon:yes stop_codon:yes gene_type:complete
MVAKKVIFKALLLLCSFQSFAQYEMYQKKEFIKNLDTLKYRVLYPKDFSEDVQYPIVFFLHGAGERGNDNEKQLIHGSSLFSKEETLEAFPAIVIFPQCPTEDYWSNAKVNRKSNPIKFRFRYGRKPTKALSLVIDLVNKMIQEPFVKKDQVYVMGLSMGGLGTYEILYRKPELFAAAIAICGGGKPKSAKKYAIKVPLWAFHGAKDNVVDPTLSLKMVAKLLKYGGQPQFTLYEDANHNSWDSAFAEPNLLKWLFLNKLRQ